MQQTSVILVVDDDPGILKLVRMQLAEDGFRVLTAGSGEEGIELVDEQRPDLILLDVMLPGVSGYEVMRSVRERYGTPIVLLTARTNDVDKVLGLEMGADDYVPKPFNPEELSARVRAVLRRVRRSALPGQSHLSVRDLEIDLERRVVTRCGDVVQLTRTEWNLLQALAENSGKVMLSAEILAKVWGPEYRDDVQYLRVWVSRLRRKLEPDRCEESVIRTFPGMGYMLGIPAESGEPAPTD